MAEFEKKTEFNAAIASLMRLHELLIECNKYRILCRANGYNIEALKQWKYTIDAVYSEMYPKIAPDKSKLKKINNCFGLYKRLTPIIKYKVVDHETINTLDPHSFDNHYKVNDLIEKNLRLIADKKGMLIPDETDMFGR